MWIKAPYLHDSDVVQPDEGTFVNSSQVTVRQALTQGSLSSVLG